MSAAIATVGFVGLGTMGAPMARNLLAAGFALRAYDVVPAAVAALVAAGASAASSAAEAANGTDSKRTLTSRRIR